MVGVTRQDPGLDAGTIATCLADEYGLRADAITYLPLGFDLHAAVYEVVADTGAAYFLKIRTGPIHEPSLAVPRALRERGVPNILAPLRTRSAGLWAPLEGDRRVVLYPFVRGESAADVGLTAAQWREFGRTLRAVHDSGLDAEFRGHLPVETFALPAAAPVRQLLETIEAARVASPAASEFARFWRDHAGELHAILARAEELGTRLRIKRFAHVLCHADIHAANILVDEAGQIHLVDWDGPKLAPRERDLLFVVGAKIAREVEPWEEADFFAGYGPVAIDPEALVYYRYERVIEDLAEIGQSVFLDADVGEELRADEAALAMDFFAPGGMLEGIETVVRHGGNDRSDRG